MRHWLWASFLVTSSAFAFNMGDIAVSSSFNEPLVATIPLELSPGTTAFDYKFALQGFPSGMPPVEVSVDPREPNIIRLTSTSPIHYNYIQFDLLAKTQSEELRQAYLITFDKKSNSKVPKPLVYGPIKDGETLWNAAKIFADHYGIPVEQSIEQLYSSNPRSFANGRKDALMAGTYLRLPQMHVTVKPNHTPAPAPAKMAAAPAPLQQAVKQEVAAAMPALPDVQVDGKAVAVNMNGVSGSLELLVPNGGAGKPVIDNTEFMKLLDKIQSELLLSREAIDIERQAKEALQLQLSDMQIQIKALTELIHLKDDETKALLASVGNFIPENQTATVPSAVALPWHNNQIILLCMAVVVASFMVYIGDYLSTRRQQKPVPAAVTPSVDKSKPATIKTQSLQPPPLLLHDIDVYVARGRYSQAEDMLEQALSHRPNDFDVLYKLFQVHVKSDNRNAYETKVARISPRWKQKYPARWQRVQDLYDRAWPMGFESMGSGGGGDDAYEGDPPSDPVQTKLELAKAYIDIGNHENAVEILLEVVHEGNEEQALTAQMLLSNIKH